MVSVNEILATNKERMREFYSPFNPVSGLGSIGSRTEVTIADHPIKKQWLPDEMLSNEFVAGVIKQGGIRKYLKSIDSPLTLAMGLELFTRLRYLYDFPYWAYMRVPIKNKDGGEDIRFKLNRPQRRLIACLERMRLSGKPIRLVLLKARQWGGSTVIQIYFAWLQLVHKVGLNSLIISQVKDTSAEIQDMFVKLITDYPTKLLSPYGDGVSDEPKMVGVRNALNVSRIPQRNCKIKIGTAEKPNSCRGGDYALVHCSEVAFWQKTDNKTPEDIVRSATSGIKNKPYTAIIYESTANGFGNFFEKEYSDAKAGSSAFHSFFVPWFEIENNVLSLDDERAFAQWLFDNRNNDQTQSVREDTGAFLWSLWLRGATLEAINWYVTERRKYTSHADLAAECPSDDIEAFKHSGDIVFPADHVDALKPSCRPPRFIGDVFADTATSINNVRFRESQNGGFYIWSKPEIDDNEKVLHRYLVVVDIGGRGRHADYSVICVFDRLFMLDGDKPVVVAQWYGHTDMDILAWKAAQIASYYDDALLVIESNTLETKDRDRVIDGDQAPFILNQIKDEYDNLYARKQSEEDIREGRAVKYGFHTNVATKPKIIAHLIAIVRDGLYTERDERCLDEYKTYERKQNGSFGAIVGKHDDLLMTRAIGLWICFREMDLPRFVPRTKNHSFVKRAVSAATL